MTIVTQFEGEMEINNIIIVILKFKIILLDDIHYWLEYIYLNSFIFLLSAFSLLNRYSNHTFLNLTIKINMNINNKYKFISTSIRKPPNNNNNFLISIIL